MARFKHDADLTKRSLSTGLLTSAGSFSGFGGSGGGASSFGYGVGMYAAGSIMSAGGGFMGGILGGALLGGLATLAALVLGDIFGDSNQGP